MWIWSIALLGLSFALALPVVVPGSASARQRDTYESQRHSGDSRSSSRSYGRSVVVELERFAAPFICGTLAEDGSSLLAGNYRSSIQILNLTNEVAELTVRVLLVPEKPGPGLISMARMIKVGRGQALQLGCAEIAQADFGETPPEGSGGQGFVQIQTRDSISVSVTQSAGGESLASMQTFPVEPETIRVEQSSDRSDKVVVCHAPPGNPSNEHTIEIDASALDAHLAHGDYEGYCDDEDDFDDDD